MKVSLVLFGVVGWLVALAALAFPAAAQSPLYVDCATVTPFQDPTPFPSPSMERGTATATQVRVMVPDFDPLWYTATAIQFATPPYPTMPQEFISTPEGSGYLVVSITGVKVRNAPSLQAVSLGTLRYGDEVQVLGIVPLGMDEYLDGYKWGRILLEGYEGYVAIVSRNRFVLMKAVQ